MSICPVRRADAPPTGQRERGPPREPACSKNPENQRQSGGRRSSVLFRERPVERIANQRHHPAIERLRAVIALHQRQIALESSSLKNSWVEGRRSGRARRPAPASQPTPSSSIRLHQTWLSASCSVRASALAMWYATSQEPTQRRRRTSPGCTSRSRSAASGHSPG